MPDVRLAATGMESCPASDEDTEDELETARRNSTRARLMPSTSRQLVRKENDFKDIKLISFYKLNQFAGICEGFCFNGNDLYLPTHLV